MSARTKGRRGVEPVSAGILRTRREGSIFHDFVRTSFMDGPLIKIPIMIHNSFALKLVHFVSKILCWSFISLLFAITGSSF